MGQVYRKLIILTALFIIIFPSLALAGGGMIKNNNQKELPKVIEYSGEFDSNLKAELMNNDSPAIRYNGKTFTEAGKDFTYFLWNTTAGISSSVKARNITIQLKDSEYFDGGLQIYVDNNYLGEVDANSHGSKYIQITNLPDIKHTVTLKQREGHIKFDWIGFGDKKGDINPPDTILSFSPELVNGQGGEDTELSFFTEDDINEEIEPSGIARTLYSIDGDTWLEYEGAFTLKKGEHQIRYYTIDNNNNQEEIKASSVIVKTTAPEIAYK